MEKILYKCYTEERDGKMLFIFPDKPFWFIADSSIKVVVDYFSGLLNSSKDINNKLITKFGYTNDEAIEVVNFSYSIFKEGKLFDNEEFDLKNQINTISNRFTIPVINVTRNCNLKCKHCYAEANFIGNNSTKYDELSTDELKKVIDEILSLYKENGENKILLTGGEPFLRKDFMEILDYINSKNSEIFVNTNSLLISDEQMKKLKEYNVELLVSLDGCNKETHEFLRGKNTYDFTIEQIKKLKSYGIITKLSLALHSKNYNELEGFFELAEHLNVDSIAINNLNILKRADDNQLERVCESKLNQHIENLLNNKPKFFSFISLTDYANMGAILLLNLKFIYCGVGSASLVIDSNGDIFPCYNTMLDDFKLGNIRTDNIKEVWKNSKKLNELRSLNINQMNDKCSNCAVKYYCGGGCRGETYYAYKSLTAPNPNCDDIYNSIIDFMFRLSERNNEVFQQKISYYKRQINRHLFEK